MNELALFAGYGGGILGGHLLGWTTICAVEKDAGRARILAARQNDGLLPPFPIWSDVATFDGTPWRGCVDVVSGGSPCQGFSTAGQGLGLDDPRSVLILEVLRITGEVRPRFVLLENSPVIRRKGLALVIGRFAALGYDCRWDVFSVAGVGGHHLRRRLFFVAHANEDKCPRERLYTGPWSQRQGAHDIGGHVEKGIIADLNKGDGIEGRLSFGTSQENTGVDDSSSDVVEVGRTKTPAFRKAKGPGEKELIDVLTPNALQTGLPAPKLRGGHQQEGTGPGQLRQTASEFHRWPAPPDMVRMVHGVSRRMERIEGLGDAQVPRVVQAAWTTLTEGWL